MKIEAKIPTILGIIIIVISLGATVLLFNNMRDFLGRASPDANPTEIKITNLSDSSFTVSWTTAGNVSGTINFGSEPSMGNVATDDRDQISGKTGQYLTHHLTLRYLKPQSKYYFKIISGGTSFDNKGEPYIVTTAPQMGTSVSGAPPIYGTIAKSDGSPAAGAIVYLTLPGGIPLSTLVKSSGNWLIALNNARTADLSGFIKLTGTEKIDIFVQAGSEGTARAVARVISDSPISQIVLGKRYDFSQETASLSATAEPSLGFKAPATATPSPSLTSPASDSALPSDRPIFAGRGIPGKAVTIKVESPAPVTGTTSVDQNGNWTWTPPSGLSPGSHTVTVATTDSAGNPLQFTRNFTVLASGTQVTESATPSATATSRPSPTARPTIKPSVTATASTAPASGNVNPTILITLLGITLVVLGTGRFLLLDRP